MKWTEMTPRQRVWLEGWIVTGSRITTIYVERQPRYEFVTVWQSVNRMLHVKVEARRV
jgi:hypothetical protein